MDKEQLSQLRYLSKEIELLEEQIKNIDYTMTTDSVKGSDANFPYTYHSITIKGVDIEGYNNKARRLQKRLSRRKHELIDLVNELNNYIDDIEDSEIRQMIVLKYVKNFTWSQIAKHLGYADESVPRKKLDRYFKMTDKSENKVI